MAISHSASDRGPQKPAALGDGEPARPKERATPEPTNPATSGFLATVSHEFRTPLNGILGLTSLLLESKLTPEQETYVRGVRSSGEVLLRLVNDILDYSRIEAGGFDLHPEPADVGTMVQDIGELLATRAYAKPIDLAVDIDRGLPRQALVDATRLRQVLANLVGNAVKFTESGGLTVKAERLAGAAHGIARIEVSVADSGPGIDPADSQRIFGEFEQIDNGSDRLHDGTGLGLAISRRIVRRMGGDITLRPRPGGGSVFSFTLDLPVVAEASQSRSTEALSQKILILAPLGSEPAVLAGYLAEAGAEVHIESEVEAAVECCRTAADVCPGTVLVDHRVKPDPVTALFRIRAAANGRLAGIVLIEPTNRGALATLRDSGFDAYLVRPVRRSSLLKIVADVAAAPGRAFRSDPEDQVVRKRLQPAFADGLRVLVAEDNEVNALLVRSTLEGLGCRVIEVRNGDLAIDAATSGEQSFAAILMDLHMPGVDGITAASVIRDYERRTGRPRAPIVALTADVLAETRLRAVEAGFDTVLEKPIAPERLRRILAEMTGQPVEPVAD